MLGQRLQEDLHRLDQEVSLRAPARSVTDSTAALQSELHELRAANDELKRELRSQASTVQELKDMQSGFALKSSVPTDIPVHTVIDRTASAIAGRA